MEFIKGKNYLFVCAYGQSRSVYFAKRFNDMGLRAAFAGICDESDIKLTKGLVNNWANVIILLDKDIERNDFIAEYEMVCESSTPVIKYYIEDGSEMELREMFDSWEIKNKTESVSNCKTVEELINVIMRWDGVMGSREMFPIDYVRNCVREVYMGGRKQLLTRTYGLRDKVLELRRFEYE